MATRFKDHRARAIVAIGGTIIAAAGMAAFAFGGSPVVAGCTIAAVSSIKESSHFTPYDQRLTHVPSEFINPEQVSSETAVVPAPSVLDGLGVAWSANYPNGSSATYYFDKPIGPTMTSEEFFAAGGVLLLTDSSDPEAGPYVGALDAELGDRVTTVQVGRFAGALTWADPLSNGVRPHYLTWSDGATNFTLIGLRPAEEIVNAVRDVLC